MAKGKWHCTIHSYTGAGCSGEEVTDKCMPVSVHLPLCCPCCTVNCIAINLCAINCHSSILITRGSDGGRRKEGSNPHNGSGAQSWFARNPIWNMRENVIPFWNKIMLLKADGTGKHKGAVPKQSDNWLWWGFSCRGPNSCSARDGIRVCHRAACWF